MSSDSQPIPAGHPDTAALVPLPPGVRQAIAGPPPVSPRPPELLVHRVETATLRPGTPAPRRAWRLPAWAEPWLRRQRRPWVSFASSAVLHAVMIIALGWVVVASLESRGTHGTLSLTFDEVRDPFESHLAELRSSEQPLDARAHSALDQAVNVAVPRPVRASGSTVVPQANTPAGVESVGAAELLQSVDRGWARLLDGRAPAARAALADRGGTPDSEQAVERGLRWLAAHQLPDGSWRFNHQVGPCNGYCRHPGTVASTTGATALALLPFLGAGHTHRSGDYQQVVASGLNYLCQRMVATPHGGDLQEGTMYAQGLAGIALCEAFAMTQDGDLLPYARAAIDFIVYAQDRAGGGWRYQPGVPGDTTVTGWQVMALKSAQIAYLAVPPETFQRTTRFLDSVAQSDGAFYGYLGPGKEPTNTAIGLLCRMYSGWNREQRPLALGVKYLAGLGPSPSDMYFNYYTTQVLHHYGGPEWVAWNAKMRDYLVRTQETRGHESGSWYFKDQHGDAGGRLYNTAVAVLTLEVYYRYLPLYGTGAVDGW